MCRSPRSLVAVLALVLVVGVAACGGSGGASSSGSSGGGQRLDQPYTTLDGASTTLASYKGTPVLVNFFASTCQPCLKEMPALEQVKQEAAGKVRFVGIDVGDTVEGTRSFVAAVKVTWDIGRDPRGELTAALGSVGLPTTAVLDADGTVVYSHLGPLDVTELRGVLHDRGLL